MEENHTTLLSGVGLFALLSQEKLGRIANGIPAKSFDRRIVVKDAQALERIADEVA